VIVDAQAYYAALVEAWRRAERSIWMVGWDFHSRTRLLRDDDAAGDLPSELAEILDELVRRRPDLEINVLGWDFALIYALEREALPLVRMGLATHGRVRFHLDDRHPIGGSQHQKIVVVDDRVAFSGGLDITACRWDTPEHAPDDPRREDPGFGRYGPFHDVQMAVEGEAARALGEIVRERWRRAVGRDLPAPDGGADVWPPELEPDFTDVTVGIARTAPDPGGGDVVREVEAQYEAAFRAARRSIYVENQYFSATRLSRVLAERLAERDGPEVVLVLPASSGGWLEEATMGVRRTRLLRELCEADGAGRLRVLTPRLPGVAGEDFTVHAKLLVVDDALLRVGSANLSNRSMGLDSECDLTIESEGDPGLARQIRAVRDRLLAEHLDRTPEEVARAIESEGSLLAGLDTLRGEGRSLVDLGIPDHPTGWLDAALSRSEMLDPERPMPIETWLREQPESEETQAARSFARRLAVTTVGVAALAAAIRWSRPDDLLVPDTIASIQQWLVAAPGVLPAAALLAAVCSLALVPLTAVGLVYGVLLPPWTAVVALVIGAVASVPVGYWVGDRMWRERVRALAGRHLNRLARGLVRASPRTVALLRHASGSPFGLINLVAGASHVPLRPFLLGTLLGIVPGVLLLVGWTHLAWWLSTAPRGAPVLVVVAAVVLFGATLLRRRWFSGAEESRASARG
jgi:phosphatidylserine/phosphatidylglycerophosphate/cardiolipin synthase-like enzyme/uncharacterized membrane protein YdjX (TVP38/TMEM64 family)